MKPGLSFGELLAPARIRTPLESRTLTGALQELTAMLDAPGEDVRDPVDRILTGDGGALRRIGNEIVVAALSDPGPESAQGALGVRAEGIDVDVTHPGLGGDGGPVTVVLVALSPRSLADVRRHLLPRTGLRLASERVLPGLLQAASAEEVLAIPGFAQARIAGQLRVEDAMSSAHYRVFADTPVLEILDLLARRHLAAVPVVGPDFEVVGLVRQADLLEHLLPVWMAGDEGAAESDRAAEARDVMERAVLCVAEDGSLAEAAALMMNRGAQQMPVVREGRLVGILERAAVLGALNERLHDERLGEGESHSGPPEEPAPSERRGGDQPSRTEDDAE